MTTLPFALYDAFSETAFWGSRAGVVSTAAAVEISRRAAGALSIMGGLVASLQWDTPAGPSIVVAATAIFAATLTLNGMLGRRAA